MNSDRNKKSPSGWLPKGLEVQEYKLNLCLTPMATGYGNTTTHHMHVHLSGADDLLNGCVHFELITF